MGDTFSLGGMLLGASSAATQVEGGDRNNNWYDWYRRGNIKDSPPCTGSTGRRTRN